MKYYKILFSSGFEYYAVGEDSEPFWWYSNSVERWKSTKDWNHIDDTWNDWLKRWSFKIIEVSKLEVLIVIGSVKE